MVRNIRVTLILIVIVALRTVPQNLERELE